MAALKRTELDVHDQVSILNNYAVGVQRALDAKECPRCQELLSVRKDRLLSTARELWLVYSCPGCLLELSRSDLRPWWRRLF